MNSKQAFEFWRETANNASGKYCTKLKAANDFTQLDADFLRPWLHESKTLLDIGSGEGLLVNRIAGKVKFLTAVEPFVEFSKHIVRSANVEIVNSTIQDFTPAKKYDVSTILGVVQYFSRDEIFEVYSKCMDALDENGVLIVKNQFGINSDVLVSGYSKELGRDYFSEYRKLENEIELLARVGFKDIKAFDIYPPENNRWTNTHFHALVAHKG